MRVNATGRPGQSEAAGRCLLAGATTLIYHVLYCTRCYTLLNHTLPCYPSGRTTDPAAALQIRAHRARPPHHHPIITSDYLHHHHLCDNYHHFEWTMLLPSDQGTQLHLPEYQK